MYLLLLLIVEYGTRAGFARAEAVLQGFLIDFAKECSGCWFNQAALVTFIGDRPFLPFLLFLGQGLCLLWVSFLRGIFLVTLLLLRCQHIGCCFV